jgi:hypothetical protein
MLFGGFGRNANDVKWSIRLLVSVQTTSTALDVLLIVLVVINDPSLFPRMRTPGHCRIFLNLFL